MPECMPECMLEDASVMHAKDWNVRSSSKNSRKNASDYNIEVTNTNTILVVACFHNTKAPILFALHHPSSKPILMVMEM